MTFSKQKKKEGYVNFPKKFLHNENVEMIYTLDMIYTQSLTF